MICPACGAQLSIPPLIAACTALVQIRDEAQAAVEQIAAATGDARPAEHIPPSSPRRDDQCQSHAKGALAHLLTARAALKPVGGRLQVGAVKDARQAILDAERALLRITQQGG